MRIPLSALMFATLTNEDVAHASVVEKPSIAEGADPDDQAKVGHHLHKPLGD